MNQGNNGSAGNIMERLESFASAGIAAQRAVESKIEAIEAATCKEKWLKHPFINATAVREFLLDHAATIRPFHKFNRVSEDTLIAANEALRQWLITHVKRMPSKGKTL